MTIELPEDLAIMVREEVLKGHFACENDLVVEAVRLYLRQKASSSPLAEKVQQVHGDKRIWEIVEAENQTIPPDVWDALPKDLSARHDDYLYGTMNRPV